MHVLSLVKAALLSFFAAHEYPALFILILIEEAGVPLPLPGDTLVALAGTRAQRTPLEAATVIGIVALAVTIGSSLLYLLVQRGGPRVNNWLVRLLHLRPERVARMQGWFHTRGVGAILIGRLIPGLRIPTTVMAGLSGVPYRIFLPSTGLAAIVWAAFFYLLGDVLQRAWAPLAQWVNTDPDQLIGYVVLLLTVVGLWFWLRDRRGSAHHIVGRLRTWGERILHSSIAVLLLRLVGRLRAWGQALLRSSLAAPLLLVSMVSLPTGTSFVHLSREVREPETLVVDQHLVHMVGSITAALSVPLANAASLPGSAAVVTGAPRFSACGCSPGIVGAICSSSPRALVGRRFSR